MRSPQIDSLLDAVVDAVPAVDLAREGDGAALLTGVEAARVGEIAAGAGLVLHELATRTASLEEAFFEATGASEEYVARLAATPPTSSGGVP